MAETRRIAELDSNGTLKPDQVPAGVVHQTDLGPAAAMTPAEVVTDEDAQAALSATFAPFDVVEHKGTPNEVTITLGGSGSGPLWMSRDGRLLFGGGGPAMPVSADEGASWTNDPHEFPENVTAVRDLGNGELLVAVAEGDESMAALWRSSGWSTDPTTANWTKVLEAHASGTSFTNDWSIDAHPSGIVVAAEYGTQGVATKAWLSEDHGETWTEILDIGEGDPPNYAHIHGICWDPYYGWIWVTTGDGTNNCTIRYSADMGQTWTIAHQGSHQAVGVIALPHCVLFTSDMPPNGIYRMRRTVTGGVAPIEVAHLIDNDSELTQLGGLTYRRGDGYPTFLTFKTKTGGVGGGRVIATWDGFAFTELWHDELPGTTAGITTALGPSASYRLFARGTNPERGGSFWWWARMPAWQGADHHAWAHRSDGTDPLRVGHLTDRKFIGPTEWAVGSGSAAATTTHSMNRCWLMDKDLTESIITVTEIPEGWEAFDAFLWWWNPESSSGDVFWQVAYAWLTEGFDVTTANTAVNAPATAGAQNIMTVTAGLSNVRVQGRWLRLRVLRLGANAADTLGNDAAVFGLELRRRS